MSTPTSTHHALDLGPMVARILLAVLAAATVVLGGIWLRDSDALGWASTVLSVTAATWIAARLRGERTGPPTAATQRLQPLVDTLSAYRGGDVLARPGTARGGVAVATGLSVATLAQIVTLALPGAWLPIWRGSLALAIVLLPMTAVMAWYRSRQTYTGTAFAREVGGALRRVAAPGGGPDLDRMPPAARIAAWAVGRTAVTVAGRILVQLVLPVLFSTPVSLAFVAVATVTAVAGGPLVASAARSARRTTPSAEGEVTDDES